VNRTKGIEGAVCRTGERAVVASYGAHHGEEDPPLDADGIAQRGLLVRHLVMPNGIAGTEQVLSFLASEISLNTYLNLMDQYRPYHRAREYPELARPITRDEYREALAIATRRNLCRRPA
jgi:putative pyruvate formate lyase activating enzyme